MSAQELKHTPEPWETRKCLTADHQRVASFDLVIPPTVNSVGAEVIASVWGEEANAARIVACVNACAGIADPTALRAQRDALLEALEEANFIIQVHAIGAAILNDRMDIVEPLVVKSDEFRAAIALAQGEGA